MSRARTAGERPESSGAVVVVPGVPWGVAPAESGAQRNELVNHAEAGGSAGALGGESGWAKVINRRYHLTIASLAYVATTCVLVVGAVNGQNNLLFWIFGIAVSGLAISGLVSGSSLMGIRIRRDVLDPARAGEAFHIRYTVHNANRFFGAFALVIEEMGQSRGWLGKKFSGSWPARVLQPRLGIAYLGPRQTLVVDCRCEAIARGAAMFGPVRVSSTFPFGITRKSVTFAQSTRITIRPQRVALASDVSSLASHHRQESTSMIRSRTGDETFALREHSSGDPMRAIAWRASARMARPIVRDYSRRTGGRVWIMLDDSRQESEGADREAFERAVMVTSSILDAPFAREQRPGFVTASRGVMSEPGNVQQVDMDDFLAVVEPGGVGSVNGYESLFASSQVNSTDSIVLVSPSGRAAGIRQQAGQVVVLDPQAAASYAGGVLPAVAMPVRASEQSWFERAIENVMSAVDAVAGKRGGSGGASGAARDGGAA